MTASSVAAWLVLAAPEILTLEVCRLQPNAAVSAKSKSKILICERTVLMALCVAS